MGIRYNPRKCLKIRAFRGVRQPDDAVLILFPGFLMIPYDQASRGLDRSGGTYSEHAENHRTIQ